MALVDYGSDSDSGSPRPHARANEAAASAKRALPAVADLNPASDNDDDDDDDFNPSDAFGLARIEASSSTADLGAPPQPAAQQRAGAGADSAPQVIAAVSPPLSPLPLRTRRRASSAVSVLGLLLDAERATGTARARHEMQD